MALVTAATATFKGSGDLDQTFRQPAGRPFKLVFVRIHFIGGSGTATVTLSLDSVAGEEFDTQLVTAESCGPGADLNLVWTVEELSDPSPWSFQPGDGVRVRWTAPDGTSNTWGVEIGYRDN